MKTLILIILSVTIHIAGHAQLSNINRHTDIDVVNFQEFEPYLALRDDTVRIVNFWATWCVPCIKELPIFSRAQEIFQDYPVKISLVSLDFPSQIESRLIPFIQGRNITAEVILLDDPNANRWIPKVNPDWSGAIPATIIFSSKGQFFKEGMMEEDELIQIIRSFL